MNINNKSMQRKSVMFTRAPSCLPCTGVVSLSLYLFLSLSLSCSLDRKGLENGRRGLSDWGRLFGSGGGRLCCHLAVVTQQRQDTFFKL
jgi:hypothetical protein